MTFTGKIAVVTGGASGLGEACARLLAAEGATGTGAATLLVAGAGALA